MSHLTCCRLTAISIGVLLLNAIAINPATASQQVAIIDRPTPEARLGLDIGLQPIIPPASTKRIALNQGATGNARQPLGVGVTARVGTLGIGVDVAKSFTSQLSGRLGFNFGSVGFNRTDSGIDYNSQLNLSSVQLFGDYYPINSSSFRITGGLVAQNNRFSVTGKPSGNSTYTIDGTQYAANSVGTLSGEYKYGNSIAPYLGIGIGKPPSEGLGFNADLGVMFTGSPQVTLNASNPAFNNSTALNNQARQTENDLRGFSVYPVLSIGLSYGF
jgi:hypothetical protein